MRGERVSRGKGEGEGEGEGDRKAARDTQAGI